MFKFLLFITNNKKNSPRRVRLEPRIFFLFYKIKEYVYLIIDYIKISIFSKSIDLKKYQGQSMMII